MLPAPRERHPAPPPRSRTPSSAALSTATVCLAVIVGIMGWFLYRLTQEVADVRDQLTKVTNAHDLLVRGIRDAQADAKKQAEEAWAKELEDVRRKAREDVMRQDRETMKKITTGQQ